MVAIRVFALNFRHKFCTAAPLLIRSFELAPFCFVLNGPLPTCEL
jgi:hypothetical protein